MDKRTSCLHIYINNNFPNNVSCERKEKINERTRREGCLFLIEMYPETPESCNQIGHQMFSGAVSCTHADTNTEQHLRNAAVSLQSSVTHTPSMVGSWGICTRTQTHIDSKCQTAIFCCHLNDREHKMARTSCCVSNNEKLNSLFCTIFTTLLIFLSTVCASLCLLICCCRIKER